VTAPLTPNDQQPPFPPGPDEPKPTLTRDLRDGVIVLVAVTVCGLALGALWLWLAPRVPLYSDGSSIYLKEPEAEQAIGADGWFTLLGLGMGLLTAAGVYRWRRTGGAPLVLGLAIGGVLASFVAWRMGVLLGPPHNVVAHAKQAGVNKVFYAPLQLHAKGALLAWTAAAMAGYLSLLSLFTPDRPAAPTQWPGWNDPRQPQPPYPPQQYPYAQQYPQQPPYPLQSQYPPGSRPPTGDGDASGRPDDGGDRS
jgi:hypothetical protein